MKTISFDIVMGRFASALGLESDRAIADCLGISAAAYSNRKVRGSIPYDEVVDYLNTQNLDIGEVLFPSADLYKIKPTVTHQLIEEKGAYEACEFVSIPHYDIHVSAGHGVLNSSEELLPPLAFRRDWLRKRNLTPNKQTVVTVKGHSMERELYDGDLVLVNMEQTTITSGETYVLRVDGQLFVKNLELLPNGIVQVSSFNAGFPPYQVDLSNEALDMTVIGKVVASMHEW